jgi:SAM-dependent methyltransferase
MPTLDIPTKFNRSAHKDPDATAESAVYLLRYICDKLGLPDLSQQDMLDVGCGTKFTQALLNHGLSIKSYVGVDVYREMIDFLCENVADPRFEYHHVDVQNDLYNPDAPPMTAHTDLGVGHRTFDVICLFSVFTHLAPRDYTTMLRMLRRYVRPSGRLIYTLFIDELTEHGYGFIDRVDRDLRSGSAKAMDDRSNGAERDIKPFVDVYPDNPLLCALYSRDHAYELIDGTGWAPLELLPPNKFAQHHFICAPV